MNTFLAALSSLEMLECALRGNLVQHAPRYQSGCYVFASRSSTSSMVVHWWMFVQAMMVMMTRFFQMWSMVRSNAVSANVCASRLGGGAGRGNPISTDVHDVLSASIFDACSTLWSRAGWET